MISKWIREYYDLSEDDNLYYAFCDRIKEVVLNIGTEDMYNIYVEYLSGDEITASDVLKFANTFWALGLQDFKYENPYKLIALLYHKASGELRECHEDNILWSISVQLVQNTGSLKGYPDEYNPTKDEKVLSEISKLY